MNFNGNLNNIFFAKICTFAGSDPDLAKNIRIPTARLASFYTTERNLLLQLFLNFITPQQIVYHFMINLHICKDELDATTTTGAHPTKFAHLQR